MSNFNRYILYRTSASGTQAAGYVVNAFIWDGEGQALPVPSGMEIAHDPLGQYPIGSIYAVPA